MENFNYFYGSPAGRMRPCRERFQTILYMELLAGITGLIDYCSGVSSLSSNLS